MLMDSETFVRYLPMLVDGGRTTLLLFLLTIFLGFAIALPVALANNARSVFLHLPALGFILLFRGAPLLSILFLVYYGLPQIPGIRETPIWLLIRDPFPVAVIALALNSAGFQAAIIAGALKSIPQGEVDAARAAGFSATGVFRHVSARHAASIALRAFANEVVFVLKGTAVVSFITVRDLMGAVNQVYFRTFDPITPLVAAGVFYLVVVGIVMWMVAVLERRLNPRHCVLTATVGSVPAPPNRATQTP
jgi:His/Glu/Gln/Arg/opine family amino acid ABC transporter permease subunit